MLACLFAARVIFDGKDNFWTSSSVFVKQKISYIRIEDSRGGRYN